MKKTLLFCLCVLMAISLFACNSHDEVSDGASEGAGTEVSEESKEHTPVDIKINGVSLKEFTLVYCESTTYDSYNHYRLIVDEINDFLKHYCGYTLKAVPDSTPETEYELLIGFTAGRALRNAFDRDSFEKGQYSLVVSGTKVMLAGSHANGWHYAFEKLKDVINADKDGNLTDFMTSNNVPVVKVACVGDSITQGVNSVSNDMTYPAYLQEMLGWEYCVLNAGLSGYAVCDNDNYAYSKTAQYRTALDFEPDVVIYALGTNDSNPSQEWKDWSDPTREDMFLNSVRGMLNAFKGKNKDVQIYMCLPTPLFDGRGGWNAPDWNKNIDAYSLPLLKQIADEYDLPKIDLYTWGKANDKIFTDGLHPVNTGYKTYAEEIYRNIKDSIKTAE